jgi:hypothetical protein
MMVYRIRDDVIARSPSLAHRKREGRVVDMRGTGRDLFVRLEDSNRQPFPGWFRTTDELIPTEEIIMTRRETLTPHQLSQQVAALKNSITALKSQLAEMPLRNAENVEREVLRLAAEYQEAHGGDLANSVRHVLGDPVNVSVAQAWTGCVSRKPNRGRGEDAQLTALARARQRASAAAGRRIDFSQAVRETVADHPDLAARFHDAIHLTHAGDGSWARESAQRDVELRRVLTERVDLAQKFARIRR